MKTHNETQLTRGRSFLISGTDASQVQHVVEDCLEEGGFHVRMRHPSATTALIVGTQRASWYRVLFSALPQTIVFEIRDEPEARSVHLRYDERLAPWYLAVLVAVAAIMTPYWLGSLAMLFRFASAPTLLQEFRGVYLWVGGAALVLFVRLMLASGAGTTWALLEEIRLRLRRLGGKVDQRQTGTITTKLLVSLLFMS